MVCLIESFACQQGRHDDCNGGQSAGKTSSGEIIFGGTLCTCPCHSRRTMSDEDIRLTPIIGCPECKEKDKRIAENYKVISKFESSAVQNAKKVIELQGRIAELEKEVDSAIINIYKKRKQLTIIKASIAEVVEWAEKRIYNRTTWEEVINKLKPILED